MASIYNSGILTIDANMYVIRVDAPSALPRIFVSNISLVTNQVSGPNEIAYPTTTPFQKLPVTTTISGKTIKNTLPTVPATAKVALDSSSSDFLSKAIIRALRDKFIKIRPEINKVRRPMASIFAITVKVTQTLITPRSIVDPNECSLPNPT